MRGGTILASINVEIGGVLLFCDQSLIKLNIGHGYVIEKCNMNDLFYKSKLSYEDHDLLIDYHESAITTGTDRYFMCLKKKDVFEGDIKKEIQSIQGIKNPVFFGTLIDQYKKQECDYLYMIFQLMRIFKTGNFGPMEIFFMFDSQPMPILHQKYNIRYIYSGRNVFKSSLFSLDNNEVLECQQFLKKYSGEPYRLLELPIRQFFSGLEKIGENGGYLEFMTALEMLLVNEKDGTKQLLANRIAVLLGKSSEDKLSYYNKIKEHYYKRSKLIHEGIAKGFSSDDVIELEEITRNIIKICLERCYIELKLNPSINWKNIKSSMIKDLRVTVKKAQDDGVLPITEDKKKCQQNRSYLCLTNVSLRRLRSSIKGELSSGKMTNVSLKRCLKKSISRM